MALVLSGGPVGRSQCPQPCAARTVAAGEQGSIAFAAPAADTFSITVVGDSGYYRIGVWPLRAPVVWTEDIRVDEETRASFGLNDPLRGLDAYHDYVVRPAFSGQLRIDRHDDGVGSRAAPPLVEFGTGTGGLFSGREVIGEGRSALVPVVAGRAYTIRVRSDGLNRRGAYRLVTCRAGEEARSGLCSQSQLHWRRRGEPRS